MLDGRREGLTATARGTDESDCLARWNLEGDIVENLNESQAFVLRSCPSSNRAYGSFRTSRIREGDELEFDVTDECGWFLAFVTCCIDLCFLSAKRKRT